MLKRSAVAQEIWNISVYINVRFLKNKIIKLDYIFKAISLVKFSLPLEVFFFIGKVKNTCTSFSTHSCLPGICVAKRGCRAVSATSLRCICILSVDAGGCLIAQEGKKVMYVYLSDTEILKLFKCLGFGLNFEKVDYFVCF